MEELEYQLDGQQELLKENNKLPVKIKIILVVLIVIIILLIITIIILSILLSQKEHDNEESNLDEGKLYRKKISNIPYVYNDIIINSFKEGSENYNELLGNINNGNDYKKTDRNVYDLYIPYTATKRKEKYNKILLLVHGGGWIRGNKEEMNDLCEMYVEMDFIVVSIEYTLLNEEFSEEYNVYKILDEITTAMKSIKNELKKEGFNEDKLELVIGGHSAGAHLSLLYAYKIKNPPIPIKFVINLCAPVSLEYEHWVMLKTFNDTLESIDSQSLQLAKMEGRIIPLNMDYMNDIGLILIMNVWQGLKKLEDFDEMLIENDNNTIINKESIIYKKLLLLSNIAYPTNYIDSQTIPTICFYGGNDQTVGIGQYAYLKDKFDGFRNSNISLIYSRYANHDLPIIKLYNFRLH